MIKEVRLAFLLLIIGIPLITVHYLELLPLNSVDGKTKAASKNINFEIFDCAVQGNSTYEKSGRCPDSASEALSNGSTVSEKVLPNAEPEQSEEPKAEPGPTTSLTDDTETKPEQSEEPKAEPGPTTSVTDDTETKPEQSEEPKAAPGQSNNFTNETSLQPEVTGKQKYDFDQIHIAGPQTSIENTERTHRDIEPPVEILTPLDPFGASVR
jgi:hypothetical protein